MPTWFVHKIYIKHIIFCTSLQVSYGEYCHPTFTQQSTQPRAENFYFCHIIVHRRTRALHYNEGNSNTNVDQLSLTKSGQIDLLLCPLGSHHRHSVNFAYKCHQRMISSLVILIVFFSQGFAFAQSIPKLQKSPPLDLLDPAIFGLNTYFNSYCETSMQSLFNFSIFFVLLAYSSPRDCRRGSVFIRCLVHVFSRHAHNTDVERMFKMVSSFLALIQE